MENENRKFDWTIQLFFYDMTFNIHISEYLRQRQGELGLAAQIIQVLCQVFRDFWNLRSTAFQWF